MKPIKSKSLSFKNNSNTVTADQDPNISDDGHPTQCVDDGQEPPNQRQKRVTRRLLSSDNQQGPSQPSMMLSSLGSSTIHSPKTRNIKKIITPRHNVSVHESDDDSRSVRSACTDTLNKGKMFPREAKQKSNQHLEHECNSITDTEKLCDRHSTSKRAAVIEFVKSILDRNEQMNELLNKFHNDLTKQEDINNRLSRRLDVIENKVTEKTPTKAPSFAQVVSMPATKPMSINKLVKIIPTLKSNTPQNVAKIVPPKGTPYPEKAVVNIYNSAEHNVKVRNLQTASTKDLIVRTNIPDDINKLAKSTALAKHGYKVIPFKPRNPKILIFGVSISDKKLLVESFYYQNEEVAGDDIVIFDQQFRPSHSWSRNKRTHNWVVGVDRKRILVNGSRIYNQWQAHRVVDYIDVTRCFKCQKFGHVSKYCQQKEERCRHCSQQGHGYKICLNLNNPPVFTSYKQNKLPAAHRIADKTCPSFIKDAKQQLLRTNFDV